MQDGDCAKKYLLFLYRTGKLETVFHNIKRLGGFFVEKGGVQSLDRAFQLLELLCKSPDGMAIHQLSELTGLHKSTVHRLLNTMMERGYVRREAETAIYHAGMRICELSDYIQQSLDVVALAREPMERLSRKTGETVHLVERDENEIVYIYKVESLHGAIRMVSRIGMRRPLYCTGMGKAILATCSDEEVLQHWNEVEHVSYTANTIVRTEAFLREIRHIRQCGYALDNEENELGVRCVAAAIPDWQGRVSHALSISAPLSRMTDERLRSLVPELLATRNEIAACLGGRTT
ncbi:hypothetical protein B5E43_08170 [Flavonifractor sp. An100]|nr:hypothetical protein B5E43_08170 [Flavonifractor sp. An100]